MRGAVFIVALAVAVAWGLWSVHRTLKRGWFSYYGNIYRREDGEGSFRAYIIFQCVLIVSFAAMLVLEIRKAVS